MVKSTGVKPMTSISLAEGTEGMFSSLMNSFVICGMSEGRECMQCAQKTAGIKYRVILSH